MPPTGAKGLNLAGGAAGCRTNERSGARLNSEDLARLKQQLTLWRTILVDGQTGLPAYEIRASADQLDDPVWKVQYTYPRDITIEPPVQ